MPQTTVYDMVPLLPHVAYTCTNRNVFRSTSIFVSNSRPHLQQGAPIFQMPMDWSFILRLIAAGTE
jgi:hypothetical protein